MTVSLVLMCSLCQSLKSRKSKISGTIKMFEIWGCFKLVKSCESRKCAAQSRRFEISGCAMNASASACSAVRFFALESSRASLALFNGHWHKQSSDNVIIVLDMHI